MKDAHTKHVDPEEERERERTEEGSSEGGAGSVRGEEDVSDGKAKAKKSKKRKKLVNVSRIFQIGRKLDEVRVCFASWMALQRACVYIFVLVCICGNV